MFGLYSFMYVMLRSIASLTPSRVVTFRLTWTAEWVERLFSILTNRGWCLLSLFSSSIVAFRLSKGA